MTFTTARSAACLCLVLSVGLVLSSRFPPEVTASRKDPSLEYPWIQLREPLSSSTLDPSAELVFVGDIMPGRGVDIQEGIFQSIAPVLKSADLAVGNLEGAIGSEAQIQEDQDTLFPLVIHPDSAKILAGGGFDILSLANNHSFDLGLVGFNDTLSQLARYGIRPLGVRSGSPKTQQPYYININGVRLAFIGLNAIPRMDYAEMQVGNASDYVQGWVREEIRELIHQANNRSDVVILSIHWGYEYDLNIDPGQELIARELLEMGADLIVGHHPHVIQPVQLIESPSTGGGTRNRMVAYSLGNFVFDQGFGETGRGLALRVVVDRQGLRAVQALPVAAGSHPRMIPVSESETLVKNLFVGSTSIGYDCIQYPCQPVEIPGDYASGKFHSGSIDLTGDGVGETVSLDQNRVSIYQGDELVWVSPLEWDVVDLALGDPNDDGRYEILLAIFKPDENGHLRSHPFIVGFRGGIYRLLWGGSAVSEPIYEVDLGNIDLDPMQELVVIEDAGGGDRNRIAVWNWHGWGFSKDWESGESFFSNLVLKETVPGEGLIITAHKGNPGH